MLRFVVLVLVSVTLIKEAFADVSSVVKGGRADFVDIYFDIAFLPPNTL